MASEIGRELKVSELKPQTVVCLAKEGGHMVATMWVVEVLDICVHFGAGAVNMGYFAMRAGPDLEELRDRDQVRMRVYEYLGEV